MSRQSLLFTPGLNVTTKPVIYWRYVMFVTKLRHKLILQYTLIVACCVIIAAMVSLMTLTATTYVADSRNQTVC